MDVQVKLLMTEEEFKYLTNNPREGAITYSDIKETYRLTHTQYMPIPGVRLTPVTK